MRVLMADTVYDKINLRTGFVAPINRGGWTLMCSDARRARIHYTNICYNFFKYLSQIFKYLWQVWSRLWYWESPLGGKMSGRIGHKTEMSPTFDYKLPMKTETASTWSNIRILQMFSWIYSWSRFREGKTIFYFPHFYRRLITHCASHFNPVLIIKFGFSQFFPLAAHQGLTRYPKMSTWSIFVCIDLLAQR